MHRHDLKLNAIVFTKSTGSSTRAKAAHGKSTRILQHPWSLLKIIQFQNHVDSHSKLSFWLLSPLLIMLPFPTSLSPWDRNGFSHLTFYVMFLYYSWIPLPQVEIAGRYSRTVVWCWNISDVLSWGLSRTKRVVFWCIWARRGWRMQRWEGHLRREMDCLQ